MNAWDTGDPCLASVGAVYSTGDPYDGYFPNADWSGKGRELRLFYTFACDCGQEGALHETLEAAEAEARTHTNAVQRGPVPMKFPDGAPRGDIANPS